MPKIVGFGGKEMTKGTPISPTKPKTPMFLDTLGRIGRSVSRKMERRGRDVQRPPRMMLGSRG
jgi:hypothetical protein